MNGEIRVLIVDDHPLVREGLRSVIDFEPDMEIVGEASDGREAVELARDLRPDVILMDLLMPGKDGGQASVEILQADPGAHILVLTSLYEVEKILPTILAGALGYVSKSAPPRELLEAIRTVRRGSVVLPPLLARALLAGPAASPKPAPAPGTLFTEREMEVLKLLAQGMDNESIAGRLCISARTVSVHVSHILDKLGLTNRTQAALYALRSGLVALVPDDSGQESGR